MRIIKKLLFTVLSIIFVAGTVNTVLAKSDNAKSMETGKDKQVSNTIKATTQEEIKVKNPKAREAIETAIKTAEQSEATVESSLNQMAGRPGFLKFIVGPDYKNAGQVRSEIVRLRNQISQLTRTKEEEKLSGTDSANIDQSITTLEASMTSIETRLNEALKGVSLFGWLGRLLSGFVAPTGTPVPVVTPTGTPSATFIPTIAPTPTI